MLNIVSNSSDRLMADRPGKITILSVEDDRLEQVFLKKQILDLGHATIQASDGEEAHFLGDTEPYDAIILDVGLPIMDGISVLERWRRDEGIG